MAESTLSLGVKELEASIGVHAGWGRGANFNETAWDDRQQAAITDSRNSGCRRFYYNAQPEGASEVYDWSFLRPTATFGLASGSSTIPMPDDFGGVEGRLTIANATGKIWFPIDFVSEGSIRERYSEYPTTTGRPLAASIRPLKSTSGTAGQRFEMYLFPIADQAYTLQCQYYISPDALSVAFPFPLGGSMHAETILESCLAVFEERYDDIGGGVHAQRYQERLQASINADRKLKPQTLGYNRDLSDQRPLQRNWNHFADQIAVNGTVH